MQFLDATSHMGAHTAVLNEHLWGDSDDDGADEDASPPRDAAVTSARAFDDCCEVCLNSRKDPRIALVPCEHQRDRSVYWQLMLLDLQRLSRVRR